jgi:hypothetical protein
VSSDADELYGAPPEEFVARRDAMAKELRKGGDRAGADAVKKLRKPSVAAAAVNRLAREASDEVAGLLAAGEALRQAQLGGGDRDAIRSAARDEREAVEGLVSRAGKLSPAVAVEVRSTLHAAAVDEEARDLIRRGALTEGRQASGVAAMTPMPASKKQADKGGQEAKPRAKGGAKAAAERKRAEAERKKAARERVKAARAALREAEKGANAAERERQSVAKELERADQALEAAQAEVEARRRDLDDAESA